MSWIELADRVLAGTPMTREEGLAILACPDDDLLRLLDGAFRLRRHYFGYGVQVHLLQNAKEGLCPEDCTFCSQARSVRNPEVQPHKLQSVEEMLQGARRAHQIGAARYCLVTAMRGPTERDLAQVCEAVRRIKAEFPALQVCTSLGLIDDEQARRLAEAGVNRFNHNLETSEHFYPEVCTTHRWQDRLGTLQAARRAGLELCCGGIMGLGESAEDRVDLALALRDLAVDSLPVNFLNPRAGTPLAERPRLSPRDCLRALCLYRFAVPHTEVRVAGGREVCLRSLQPLSLFAANSLFTQGYLTTGGNSFEDDQAMIEEAGFHIDAVVPVEA